MSSRSVFLIFTVGAEFRKVVLTQPVGRILGGDPETALDAFPETGASIALVNELKIRGFHQFLRLLEPPPVREQGSPTFDQPFVIERANRTEPAFPFGEGLGPEKLKGEIPLDDHLGMERKGTGTDRAKTFHGSPCILSVSPHQASCECPRPVIIRKAERFQGIVDLVPACMPRTQLKQPARSDCPVAGGGSSTKRLAKEIHSTGRPSVVGFVGWKGHASTILPLPGIEHGLPKAHLL